MSHIYPYIYYFIYSFTYHLIIYLLYIHVIRFAVVFITISALSHSPTSIYAEIVAMFDGFGAGIRWWPCARWYLTAKRLAQAAKLAPDEAERVFASLRAAGTWRRNIGPRWPN